MHMGRIAHMLGGGICGSRLAARYCGKAVVMGGIWVKWCEMTDSLMFLWTSHKFKDIYTKSWADYETWSTTTLTDDEQKANDERLRLKKQGVLELQSISRANAEIQDQLLKPIDVDPLTTPRPGGVPAGVTPETGEEKRRTEGSGEPPKQKAVAQVPTQRRAMRPQVIEKTTPGAKGEEEKKEEVEVQMPPPPARRRGGPTPAKRKNQIFLSVEAFISAWPEHQLSVMRKSPPALQLQESPALAAGEFPIWCGLCCRSVEAHKMHNAKYIVQHCDTNGHKNALAKAFQVLSGRSDAATIRGAMGGTPSDLSHDAPRVGRRRSAERGLAGCGK